MSEAGVPSYFGFTLLLLLVSREKQVLRPKFGNSILLQTKPYTAGDQNCLKGLPTLYSIESLQVMCTILLTTAVMTREIPPCYKQEAYLQVRKHLGGMKGGKRK